jgi:hypothetical protein
VKVFRPDIESWIYDCRHEELNKAFRVTPFGEGRKADGVLVSWTEVHCGMHGAADIEHLMAIDLRANEPRGALFDLAEYESWGYANGGVLDVSQKIRCVWTKGDFDCLQHEFVKGDWSETESARRFSAFVLEQLPFESAYTPRVSSLDAIGTATGPGRPVLVDGVGFLSPIAKLSVQGRLVQIFACAQGDDRLAAVFYALSGGTITEVAPKDLVPDESNGDGDHREKNPDRAIPFTRVTDPASFRTSTLARRGEARLLQVLMTVGRERALFWLAVGQAGGAMRLSGLRVASTAAEGTSREKQVPASLSKFTLPDGDSPATVEAISAWIDDVWNGPNMCDPDWEGNPESKGISLTGTIGWSPEAFTVALQPQPGRPTRVRTTISPDGKLGIEPVDCRKDE